MTTLTGRFETMPYWHHLVRTAWPQLPPIVSLPFDDCDYSSLERRIVAELVHQITKNVARRARHNRKFRREVYRLAQLTVMRRVYG